MKCRSAGIRPGKIAKHFITIENLICPLIFLLYPVGDREVG